MSTNFFIITLFIALGYARGEAPICPENATSVVFFSDPEDCSKYYECYSGIRYHMQCPEHLYWNEQQNACDYYPNVDCGTRPVLSTTVVSTTGVTTASTTSATTTTTQSTTSTTSSPTTPNYDPDPSCPQSSDNITFYPDPSDCKKYFECNRGQRFELTCPGDLLFNVNEQACDYAENVDCSGRSTPVHTTVTSPSTTTTPLTTTTQPTTTTSLPTTPNYDPDPHCPATSDNITFYPDPSDCKMYFECNRGERFNMTCPGDLLYNVNEQACDFPEHVDCVGRSTPIHTTPTTPATTTSAPTTPSYDPNPKCPTSSSENITFFPDPSDCKNYFLCNRGERFDMTCPGELLWNVNEDACDFPEYVSCDGRSTPVYTTTTPSGPTTSPGPTTPAPACPASNKNITFYPDPSDCKKYFMCNRGTRFGMICPAELLYNPIVEACDFPNVTDCSGRSTSSSATTPSTMRTTSYTTIIPDHPCKGKKDGDYAGDPNDCRIFYECLNQSGIARYCDADLYWCQEEYTCDYLSKPGCTCYKGANKILHYYF